MVCEKVSTKFLARLFCALLSFKELINRVVFYQVFSNPVQVLVIFHITFCISV